jgi:hypothetical protein
MNWKYIILGLCIILIIALVGIYIAVPFDESLNVPMGLSFSEIFKYDQISGIIATLTVENTLPFSREYTPPLFIGCLSVEEAQYYDQQVQIFFSESANASYDVSQQKTYTLQGKEVKTLYLFGQHYGLSKPVVVAEDGRAIEKQERINVTSMKLYQVKRGGSTNFPPFTGDGTYVSCYDLNPQIIEKEYVIGFTP